MVGGYGEVIAGLESLLESENGKAGLVWGPSGCGKTVLTEEVCRRWRRRNDGTATLKNVECASLFGGERGATERAIFAAFRDACEGESREGVLVLDGVDLLCPRGGGRGPLRQICSALLEALDRRPKGLRVLGTAASPEALDTSLLQSGRLEKWFELKPPSELERRDILQCHCGNLFVDESLLKSVARTTRGLLASDLAYICREAVTHAFHCRGTETAALHPADFESALSRSRPSALVEHVSGSLKVRLRNIPAVIGCSEQMEALRRSIVYPLKYPEALSLRGMKPPGVLLYGPPGCGKSLAAMAVASEVSEYARFLPIQCTGIVDKVVGKSEEVLSAVFRSARSCAPCLIFLDQIESIASRRGYQSSTQQTFDRLLSTLLVEMDGARGDSGPIVIMAATADPRWIDPALLRAGRLDSHIFFDLPRNEERGELFLAKTATMPVAGDRGELAIKFVACTEGWSRADIDHACREAAMGALRRDMNSAAVGEKDFEAAIKARRLKQSQT